MARPSVDSRWWYWVAAAPVLAAFWLLSVLWVGALVLLVFDPGSGPGLPSLVVLPLVALGVPILVVALVLPFALYRDIAAVRDSGSWRPSPTPYVVGAVGCLVAALGTAFVLGGDVSEAALYGVLVVCVLAWAGVSLAYLDRRRRHVETSLDALRD